MGLNYLTSSALALFKVLAFESKDTFRPIDADLRELKAIDLIELEEFIGPSGKVYRATLSERGLEIALAEGILKETDL